jgi:hypothetical protein
MLKKLLRNYKKKRIVSKETEKRGGIQARNDARFCRLVMIRHNKKVIIDSLVSSWNLNEIKQPDEVEERLFFGRAPMTMQYILDVQHKYWT